MQPLAYFAVRSLLGWLQWIERSDRAFISNALLLVATGAAHCWAVVYALFIAIHTRAMRYEGYHEGYTEHLPFWVSWTETLAVASMVIWWAAGFTTAAIRIIDDDARGLPIDSNDKPNILMQLMRSPKLHDGLAFAHTLSCVGLFLSILLLCIAMALMKGLVTGCELCLCFVAVGFALPHAVVAARRLNFSDSKKTEDPVEAPAPAAEAAAQEAAALGPQLCVILALADSPGHAYMWQNLTYLIAAIAFVAAVAACGRSPPKIGDAAIPPETGEFLTCIALDISASIALVICFPHLNTWHLWALSAVLIGLFVAVWFENWRELLIDLLDPLFVVRSDTTKILPGKQRDTLRKAAWATTLACAAVALWDIMLHPVQDGLFEMPDDDGVHEGLHDLWDHNKMMMLRWRDVAGAVPGEKLLLSAAAEALGVSNDQVDTQAMFPAHRMMLFKYSGPSEPTSQTPVAQRWKAALAQPKGSMAKLLETTFPASLNVTLCLHAHASAHSNAQLAALKEVILQNETAKEGEAKEGEAASTDTTTTTPLLVELPEEFVKAVSSEKDVQDAYLAGCAWWTDTLDSFYGAVDNATIEHGLDDLPNSASEEGADLATE